MKNLLVRTLTGLIFITFVIGAILWSPWAFFILFCITTFLASFEFFHLIFGNSKNGFGIFTAVIATAVFSVISTSFLIPELSFSLTFVVPLILLLPIVALLSHQAIESAKKITVSLMSVLLVAIPFSTMFGIGVFEGKEQGKWLLLAFFLTIWSYDIFAYLTGGAFGKHKMHKTISPQKSWEGAFGGLIFSLVCCYVFYRFTDILSLWQWLGFGIIVSVVGTFGDLSESLLKRSLHTKDSGKILPGHGGLLDRFDSTFFAAPFILAYLYILKFCI